MDLCQTESSVQQRKEIQYTDRLQNGRESKQRTMKDILAHKLNRHFSNQWPVHIWKSAHPLNPP